jgi:hypothetical protein
MANRKRPPLDTPLSPILVYATAVTCGVLAAIALQIQLGRAGYDLLALGQNLSSSLRALELSAAGPWWAMVALAFIVGGITAGALSRLPPPWHRYRLLRWITGTGVVFFLADTGHGAAAVVQKGTGATILVTLGALAIAAVMALGGAYLTVRR